MSSSAPTAPLDAASRRRLFVVCWALSATFNVAWGIAVPLRSIYFREPWVGLSFQQIGLLGTIQSITMTALPLFLGGLSDRSGRRKPWIVGGFLMASVTSALYLVGQSFPILAVITFAGAVSLVAYNLNVSTLATMTLDDRKRGSQFGKYRISGSIGYGIASFFLVALIAKDESYRATFLSSSFAYLACVLIALFGIRESAPAKRGSGFGMWRQVLRHRNLSILFGFTAFASIGSSMCWNFFANHLNETYGLAADKVGFLMGIQTLTEIPALIGLGWASDKWGRKPILICGFLASGVRWSLIGFAPTLGWVIPAQFLWGLGFSTFAITIALITDLVEPEARGSAIGMMNISWALGSVVGPAVGGYLADSVGLPLVFRFGGLFGCVAAVGLWRFFKVEPVPTDELISSG